MSKIEDAAPAAWQESRCRAPMWMGGSPAGLCGGKAHGHQLPRQYLQETRYRDAPYCFGHACPAHGGPQETEVRVFQDGYTEGGRPMWCAVMPDFIDLQQSPAGFDGNPMRAVAKLREAAARTQEPQHGN